ncbi:unnamed protein product [Effrenium voratum]|nr:unnamed protein product [Effrenium voratum]CAJ1435337.1 unnamed protein product [Effrenium voratum]
MSKVSFCDNPKKSGGAFTPIYEKTPEDDKDFASVNAGNPKKLKVGGGTINGQFAQELRLSGHEPDAYSPMHEGLLRAATQSGVRPGLLPAPSDLRLLPCVEAAYLYLGTNSAEAQQVASDAGRGGLVILDIFESKSRPYHSQNVAMVHLGRQSCLHFNSFQLVSLRLRYTVGPQRAFEPDDHTFLWKVRLVGRNAVAACHDYNAACPPAAPRIDKMRLCLVSGGKFAERVPKEHVARQLILGVLDTQLEESRSADALPEVQFAYDGDVFRQAWDAFVGSQT